LLFVCLCPRRRGAPDPILAFLNPAKKRSCRKGVGVTDSAVLQGSAERGRAVLPDLLNVTKKPDEAFCRRGGRSEIAAGPRSFLSPKEEYPRLIDRLQSKQDINK
jgi:hypothetical protein